MDESALCLRVVGAAGHVVRQAGDCFNSIYFVLVGLVVQGTLEGDLVSQGDLYPCVEGTMECDQLSPKVRYSTAANI